LLPGREREGAFLNELLNRVRGGHSAAIVMHGEAGVGKTALLNEAFGSVPDMRVVRAAGVESEMELPFAGLQQLCVSMLGHLGHLPPPQADALRTAFGLREGPPPDRFLVGLAVLSLLSEAARGPPHQTLSPADGLAQLSFLVYGILEHRAREHDLSIIQIRLLGVLRDRRPTMNELARLLDLDKSSVTGLVDRAERRGLLARLPSAADRRSVLVTLTDHGRSLVSDRAARFEGGHVAAARAPGAGRP
jgi:DNA-binding MarR family transcriptional regulator